MYLKLIVIFSQIARSIKPVGNLAEIWVYSYLVKKLESHGDVTHSDVGHGTHTSQQTKVAQHASHTSNGKPTKGTAGTALDHGIRVVKALERLILSPTKELLPPLNTSQLIARHDQK